MKAFCSLWFCLGKGEPSVIEPGQRGSGAAKNDLQPADGKADVKGPGGDKQRSGLPGEDRDSATWNSIAPRVDKGCGGGGPVRHPVEHGKSSQPALSAQLLHNERTLRALLHKAKQLLAERSSLHQQGLKNLLPLESVSYASCLRHSREPDLERINAQLLEADGNPRPDSRTLLRLELLLSDARRWLAAHASPAAATALLYTVGDGLMHAEHAVRSGGQVRFWQPDHVTAFLALLQTYADLLLQAGRAAQHQQLLRRRQQDEQQGLTRLEKLAHQPVLPSSQSQTSQSQRCLSSGLSDVGCMEATTDQQALLQQQASEQSVELFDQGLLRRRATGSGPQAAPQQHPLTTAVAALLLRPDWLDLLAEVLELLHFSEEYRDAARREGKEPQDALAASLQLWSFLTQLVKFAASYADSVQRMSACLQRLAALLAPPSGTVPRLLALPVAEDTLVAQLHALWLLQVLYDMPDAKVLYSPALADHYVALHHRSMVEYYETSAADPKSASAELCRIHATLLRSLARHSGHPVRAAFARVQTVGWILSEMSLESQLLPAAQQEAADGAGAEDNEDDEDESDDDVDESDVSDLSEELNNDESPNGNGGPHGGLQSGGVKAAGEPGATTGAAPLAGQAAARSSGRGTSKAFEFTYDLNEDVERLIAMEDEMGQEMELDGFDYDEEGKVLKARSEALQAAAAAAAAAAAVASPAPQPCASPNAVSDGGAVADEAAAAAAAAEGTRRMCSNTSWGASSHRSGNAVPRLALAALRTSSISSMKAPSPASFKIPAKRASNTNSMLDGASACLEEGAAEGDDSEDALLGAETAELSPDLAAAATAAERVASWSSTLVEAYAAAANGDVSQMPYPPARTRFGGAPAAGGSPPPQSSAPPNAADASGQDSGGQGPAGRAREVTSGSPVHAGPQGELHLMVNTSASAAPGRPAAQPQSASAHGRPPLPGKPTLPPLKVAMVSAPADAAAGGMLSTSARAPPPGSSRAMVLLSASNRANGSTWATSPSAAQQQPQPPAPWTSAPSPVRDLNRQFSAMADVPPAPSDAAPASMSKAAAVGGSGAGCGGDSGTSTESGASGSGSGSAAGTPRRPPQPLIPALNLKSLRRRDGGAITDTGRTVPLSSMLRTTNAGSLSNCSGLDSANTLLPTGSSTLSSAAAAAATAGTAVVEPPPPPSPPPGGFVGGLECIAEAEPRPPELAYQEAACQRLLYQDRATHLLLLKTLMDLLVAPTGALDPTYVPQYPAHSGAPHAEFVLLWHLNAPRNAGVVHDLCRGAQRRAQQAAAAAASRQPPLLWSGGDGDLRLASAFSSVNGMVAAAEAASDSLRPGTPGRGRQPPSGKPMALTDSARDRDSRSAPCQPAAFPPPLAKIPSAHSLAPTAAAAAGGTAAADAALSAPIRVSAITRALQLLTRPLFDANRYTNLQFVARGAFGDIYRARMEPPRTQAWAAPTPQLPHTETQGASAAAGGVTGAAAALVAGGVTGGAGAGGAQAGPTQVVIKTIPLPGSPFDSCVLADVFSEVSVMERFRGHDCICQLVDYGMRNDAYWIVMRRYRCSLAEWRARQRSLADAAASKPSAAAAAARVYLSALLQVVDALRLLAAQHVVHFDLKCSNVLIEPLPGVRDGELWAPVGAAAAGTDASGAATAAGSGGPAVPFRCVLADFGEARAYRCAEEAFTARNRGTEVFKSPEMLMLNARRGQAASAAEPTAPPPAAGRSPSLPATSPAAAPTGSLSPGRLPSSRPGSAAAKHQSPRQPPQQAATPSLAGAGLASDIWSLGCLAYELLSGTVLFSGDYASVTHRVAFGAGERLALTEAERARLGGLPQLVELVEGVLVRDPARRPSLERIRQRIEQVREELGAAERA